MLAARGSCSGQGDVRSQAEEQRDTNSDPTFDCARREENKIHSAVLAGFTCENLTRAPCQRKKSRWSDPAGLPLSTVTFSQRRPETDLPCASESLSRVAGQTNRPDEGK